MATRGCCSRMGMSRRVASRSTALRRRTANSVMPTSASPPENGRFLEGVSTVPKDVDEDDSTAGIIMHLIRRKDEESKLIDLIGQPEEEEEGCKVISVWGMGGIGKTTLIQSVCRSQQIISNWSRAWVTALHPFNPELLIRSLAKDIFGVNNAEVAAMDLKALTKRLSQCLKAGRKTSKRQKSGVGYEVVDIVQKYLVVVDDISSTKEWDLVKSCLENASRIIVTTREKGIAKYCSRKDKNMINLGRMNNDLAFDLFKKKVFKRKTEEIGLSGDLLEQAMLIIKKCDGLPIAISTIGGFLATKPKTATEWRKANDHISTEMEINPELWTIKTFLVRSYDGLPYHLKSCFLYLSLFPENHRIERKRVIGRWVAEGYSKKMHGMSAEELGDICFDDLLDRSMILPAEVNIDSGKTDSCHLHDFMRQICISKAREENLIFTLENGCSLSITKCAIRHLVISSNWKRNKDQFEKIDLSHVRSLTVFGEWRSFFISKMKILRVLDLEDASELDHHHLNQISDLRHLRYLSLRRCPRISNLPNSFRKLRYLQTLVITKGTTPIYVPPRTSPIYI